MLILGENATGKSSILEAIALACLSDQARDSLGLTPSKLILNSRYMGAARGRARSASNIRVEFHGVPSLALKISAGKGNSKNRGHFEPVRKNEVELQSPPLVLGYGAHRMYGKQNDDRSAGPVGTLFFNDRQLPDPQPWLASLKKGGTEDSEDLHEVVAALRHIIQIDGEFRNIEVVQAQGDTPAHCVINVVKTRAKTPGSDDRDADTYVVPQQLDIVSSGYRAILALVCDILARLMDATGGSAREARMAHAIVLIDEIEAHLHPRWKMRIISGLRRVLPNVTFIITSHDPLCVRGMLQDEVLVLNRYESAVGNSGSRLPEVVERVSDFGNIETWTVEQLLMSDLFQMFSTEAERTDRNLAEVADLLAKKKELEDRNTGETLEPDEIELIEAFKAQIVDALPYGRVELTRVVQEALAEFLKERTKSQGPATVRARKEAKKAVKEFLEDLVP